MISADSTLRQYCEIIPSRNRIVVADMNSFFTSVASGGDSHHGLSPTTVVCDELHAWKTGIAESF